MFTNQMRMTGFSGIDVADMVQQMMRAESMRLNRLTQQRQIFQWQQESLRGVTTSLNTFRNNWTDISRQLTAPTGIRNPDNFRGVSAQLNGGTTNTANGITVNTTANAQAGTHSFRVTQVAQSDLFRSGNMNTGAVSSGFDLGANNFAVVDGNSVLQNITFNVSVNGISRPITFDASDFVSSATIFAAEGAHITMRDTIEDARTTLADTMWNEVGRTAWETANPFTPPDGFGPGDTEYEDARTAWEGTRDGAARNAFISGFSIPSQAPSNASATVTAAIEAANTAVADARSAFANSTQLAALNTALTNASRQDHTVSGNMAYVINQELESVFGTNPDGTARVTASVTGNNLVIAASSGNTVSMSGNAERLGFPSGSASLNLNSNLSDFGITTETSFSIGSRNITVDGNTTVQQLMNMINENGSGARISFAASTGQFTLEGTNTGELSAINFGVGAAGVMNQVFGIDVANAERNAQNSVFELTTNGITTTMSRETNSFSDTDLGLNITWNASAAEATSATEITLAADTANTRQLVLDFVNQYNDLIRSLQDLSETARPRQTGGRGFFMPLTDEQRRGMSESEIRMWEDQARTGILHRDDTIRSIINDLRNVMMQNVTLEDGTTFNLTQMGIRLSPNWADGAVLVVDYEALDGALANNIDGVAALFTGHGAQQILNPDGSVNHNNNLSARIDSTIRRFAPEFGSDGILIQRAGRAGNNADTQSHLAQRIAEQDRRIEQTTRWLERREAQLFAQFSRMEQAMMQAQQQMTFWDQIMFGVN